MQYIDKYFVLITDCFVAFYTELGVEEEYQKGGEWKQVSMEDHLRLMAANDLPEPFSCEAIEEVKNSIFKPKKTKK